MWELLSLCYISHKPSSSISETLAPEPWVAKRDSIDCLDLRFRRGRAGWRRWEMDCCLGRRRSSRAIISQLVRTSPWILGSKVLQITIRFAPFSILVIDIFRYCREFRLSSLLLVIHLVVLAFFRLALCMFTASLCQPPLGYETFLTTSELTKPAIKFKFFGLVLGRNR